jgi:PAS domain S-box-containing protein
VAREYRVKGGKFTQPIVATRGRGAELHGRDVGSSLQPQELLAEAVEELEMVLEALQVAEVELRHQRAELAGAHEAMEAERQRYQDLFEFAPDGYLVTDAEGTIAEANRAMARLLHASPNSLVGKPLVDFIVEKQRGVFHSQLTRLRQVGRLEEWTVQLRPHHGASVPVALTGVAVRSRKGKPVTLRWLLRDVTARTWAEEQIRTQNAELEQRIVQRTTQLDAANAANTLKDELVVGERVARTEAEGAERRSAFLAEASRVLAMSLDDEAMLASVARLAVLHIADWCMVYSVDDDGLIRRVETARAEPAEEVAWGRGDDLLDTPSKNPCAAEGVRTRASELALEILDSLVEALAQDAEHLRILGEVGIQSAMVVPLLARGRLIGALGFVAPASGPCYGPADIVLAEDLAARAALAVDNARLYRQRSEIARTLQESLLPPRLPEISGFELAAVFRPAGEGIDVGGDFYDLFETGDQCWAIVMGDVSGQGSAAAAVAAMARYTVRALAMRERQPSRILTSLNEALLHQPAGDRFSEERFCTVAYTRLEPTGSGARLTIACGGHPLPLLLRWDGSVETIGRPGTLLGGFAHPRLTDQVADLGPGDAVVLYTDGVTEARAAGDLFGEDRLMTLVESCAGLGAPSVAKRIERAVVAFQGGRPHDDIAILVLRIPPAASRVGAHEEQTTP